MFKICSQQNFIPPQALYKDTYNFENQQYKEDSNYPAYIPLKAHNFNQLFLCCSVFKEASQRLYQYSDNQILPLNNVVLSNYSSVADAQLSDGNKLLQITYQEEKVKLNLFKRSSNITSMKTVLMNIYSSRHISFENTGYQYVHFFDSQTYYCFNERKGIQLFQIQDNLEQKTLPCNAKLQSGIYQYIQGFGPYIVHVIIQQKSNKQVALVELLRYDSNELYQYSILTTNKFDFEVSNMQYEFKAAFFPCLVIKQEKQVQIFNFYRRESLSFSLAIQEEFLQTSRFNNYQQLLIYQERRYQILEFDGLIMLIRPNYLKNVLYVVVISCNSIQKTKVQYSLITPLLSYDGQEIANYSIILQYCLEKECSTFSEAINNANSYIGEFYQGKEYQPFRNIQQNMYNFFPFSLINIIKSPTCNEELQIISNNKKNIDISQIMAQFETKVRAQYETSDCIPTGSVPEQGCSYVEASSSIFGKMIYLQNSLDQFTSSSKKSLHSCTTENSQVINHEQPFQQLASGNEMALLLQPEITDVKFQQYNEQFQNFICTIPVPYLPWKLIPHQRFRFFQIPCKVQRCQDLLLFDILQQSVVVVESSIQIQDFENFQNIYTYCIHANNRVRLDCLYYTLRRNFMIEACFYSGLISSYKNVTGMSNLWLDRLTHVLQSGFLDSNMMSIMIISRCFYSAKLLLVHSKIPFFENILLLIVNQLLKNTSNQHDLYKLQTKFEDVPTESVFKHRRMQSETSESLFKILNHSPVADQQNANNEPSSVSNLLQEQVFLPDGDGQLQQYYDHPFIPEAPLPQDFEILKQFEKIQTKSIDIKYRRKNVSNQLILNILYQPLKTEDVNFITLFQNIQYLYPTMEKTSLFENLLADSEHNLWNHISYVLTSVQSTLELFNIKLDFSIVQQGIYDILHATVQGTVELIVDRLQQTKASTTRKQEIIISVVEILELLQVSLPQRLIDTINIYMNAIDDDLRLQFFSQV